MGLSVDQALSQAAGGKMKAPKQIDLDLEQVDALLKRVETGTLKDGDYEIIKSMVETIHLLSQCVDEKAASIRRLLRMLFGDRTEKLKNVLKDHKDTKATAAHLPLNTPVRKKSRSLTQASSTKAVVRNAKRVSFIG